MLARIALALVIDLAEIDPVRQHLMQWPGGERYAAYDLSRRKPANAGSNSPVRQLIDQARHRAELPVPDEDEPHGLGLDLVDDELAALHPITERHDAAHPHALLLGGGNLVPDS